MIGGSEFLAFAVRADSPEQALEFLARLRARFPDATHHCWAYRVGGAYRFSDDGEPGGTAGAPILRAIEGQGIDHVMVVVVRYYGGTRLGAGGLVRAYSGAAGQCLRDAAREEVRPRVRLRVHAPFDAAGAVYRLVADHGLERLAEEYDERGLRLTLRLPLEDRERFEAALRDATRGQAHLEAD